MMIVWVTNLWTPYRHAVWRSLAQNNTLTVVLLGRTEPNRNWRAPESTQLNYRIVQGPGWAIRRGGYIGYFIGLRGIVAALSLKNQWVVLGGWETPAYWLLALLSRLRRLKRVQFNESTIRSARFSSGLPSKVRRLMYRSADASLAVGRASAVAASEYGAKRVAVVRNCVDVEHFKAASGSLADGGNCRFLYVGQLIPRKNVSLILESFALRGGSFRLTVAGKGEERERLDVLSRSLGIEDRVDFVGSVEYEDLPALYQRHDCLILASSEEVWGLVVNEALHSGCRAIVSSECGISDDLVNDGDVRLVRPDVSGIVAGLEWAVSQPSVDRNRITQVEEWAPAAFVDGVLGMME